MLNAICFGAGDGGRRLYEQVSCKYNIIGFVDNDIRKIGGFVNGIRIMGVQEALALDFDIVVITSAPGLDSIKAQLIGLGVEEKRIDDVFVVAPLESRKIFLEKLASMQAPLENDICVAEAGVFEGDFAKWINVYYPNNRLFLFDTFEGFNTKDIERELDMSNARVGDYSNTSEELVLSKMTYKENCIVCKGYFPESATEINEKFCFVNLDMDLYEPTYNGLIFFEEKMIHNGVILVHDYFADNFKGPKKAVDKFISEKNGKYSAFPIGDGISIMIIGF